VIGLLRFGDWIATISPDDMTKLRAIEAFLNMPRGQRKRAYKLGDTVRFVEGPFAGIVGRVERLDSRGRLKVFIDAIKRGASVLTTEALIEPAHPATLDMMVSAIDRN
jgi:transcriptional antiterminator NusG